MCLFVFDAQEQKMHSTVATGAAASRSGRKRALERNLRLQECFDAAASTGKGPADGVLTIFHDLKLL